MAPPLDAARVKRDFPLLARCENDRPIVYLDSAATAQKPRAVLQAMDEYYETTNANVHRGAYWLAEQATTAMEDARANVRRFIGGRSDRELIFTRNATESINLVAHSYGRHFLRPGDVVLLTHLEHHANIVPWQILAAEHGVRSAGSPSTNTASSTSPTWTGCSRASSCSASPPSRTSSARCRRCAGWPTPPMRWGRWSWSTPASTCPTTPATCVSGTSTSWRSRPTRWSARPASAPCGAARSCSMPCRRSWAAGR